jgi:hypothetical protein
VEVESFQSVKPEIEENFSQLNFQLADAFELKFL